MFNISATLNVSRLVTNPSLCLPHVTVPSFDKMSLPFKIPGKDVEIKGVVLDKDNCFAKDHDDKIWPAYEDTWKRLQLIYPKEHILIVSNSAGTNDDINHEQAKVLEEKTGVVVLRHPTKKPGCFNEILDYFKQQGIHNANEIIVVGDRLFTDMLMANMMGSYGLWLSDGVEQSQKIFPKLERGIYDRLVTQRSDNPFVPPDPASNP